MNNEYINNNTNDIYNTTNFQSINKKIIILKKNEHVYICNVIKNNKISHGIKHFFDNDIRRDKKFVIFVNGRFGCNKDLLSNYIIKKSTFNSIVINFYDIIESYCKQYNIPINAILFLFFTFDNNQKTFEKATNLFVNYFYDYITNNFDKYKVLVIKGYLFNKKMFLKINNLFDIYNIFLINGNEKKYFFNIAKKLYYDYKTKSFSINIHKYFFGKINVNKSNELLQFILTNEHNENDMYFAIENYIQSPKPCEYLFFLFYKNEFTKHKSIVSI